jgi:hypothetical protein
VLEADQLADPVFVVQRRGAGPQAELGLAVGGVLVSWALPSLPSADPRHRRLAIRTEDRTLGIPVQAWDSGRYELLGGVPAEQALAAGHLAVRLHGRTVTGPFTLDRRHAGRSEQWLLTATPAFTRTA